jgi:hypothetical protein
MAAARQDLVTAGDHNLSERIDLKRRTCGPQ